MNGVYCPTCGEMDYSAAGDRPCACAYMAERQEAEPTYEDQCRGEGHPYYGTEANCEDGRLHADGEPCLCGRCYCGAKRYDRTGSVVAA